MRSRPALEMHVAAKPAVVAPVNTNVDHDRAGFDPFTRDQLGTTHGDDQNVGLASISGGVAGPGVADGYGGVPPRPLLQQ